jgi:predicted TIM-barrel fold metal-dependent hydrolase
MSVFDEPKIDCHVHLLDPAHFPYAAEAPYFPSGGEIGSLRQMEHVFSAYGVKRALIVQPNRAATIGTIAACWRRWTRARDAIGALRSSIRRSASRNWLRSRLAGLSEWPSTCRFTAWRAIATRWG